MALDVNDFLHDFLLIVLGELNLKGIRMGIAKKVIPFESKGIGRHLLFMYTSSNKLC